MRVVLESELDFQIALAATKRRVRLVTLATVTGVWFAAAAAWLLVFVIVDHAIPAGVPDLFRYPVCALFWLGSLAWMTLAGGLPLARKINDLYIARLIENSHPEFRNALVDAIQLSQHEELPGSIRAAVMDRAARDITCIEPARCVPLHGLRRAGRACVFATAIFVVYGLLAPKDVWPSLLRGLGFDLRSPTYTRIVGLSPANGTSVLTGKPVTFSAELAGRRPETAFVRFSFDDGATWSTGQQMPLIPPTLEDSDSQWRAIKAGRDIRQSMVWQVIAGDAVSERRHIEVRPVPAITDVSVEYDYTPQSQLTPTTRPGGDIDAPRGTQVIIRAATNVEAFNSLLILGRPPEERRRVLDVSNEGTRELHIPLTVTEDDEYRIEIRDAYGEPNTDPVRYTIRVRGEAVEHMATSAPPPVEEVAEVAESEPAPAESEPAKEQTNVVRRVKAGPAKESSEIADTQPGEGEWVASTAPAGDDQPTIRVASAAEWACTRRGKRFAGHKYGNR